MQALIADPEAPREAPPEVTQPPPQVTRPCANCGAPLDPGQGWCLECGTAAPGSLGRGPGWRQALTVIALTTLVVGGAVAASYAALSNQSKRATAAPKIVRVVAAAPATPASPATPAPPSATTPSAPKLPPTSSKPPTIPKVTPTPKAAVPPVTVPKVTPTPTHTTPPSSGRSNQTGQVGRAILLDPNASNTYNPYNLPDTSFGDPSLAIDGDATTAWTYTLDPTTAGKTAVGLTIDLKSPQRFASLKIHVTSPGMRVEFYGASGQLPVSITDPGWTHLANRGHIKKQTSVALKTAGKSFRWLLVWISQAPANQTTGTVGIAELSVIR